MSDFSVRTETIGAGDQTWLGSAHGTSSCRTVTLDKAAFIAATHYPAGYLASGEPLGRITASGKYGPFDTAATDGRQTLDGFLFTAQNLSAGGGSIVAPMLDHGRIVEANLPRPVAAAGKTNVAGRIQFI